MEPRCLGRPHEVQQVCGILGQQGCLQGLGQCQGERGYSCAPCEPWGDDWPPLHVDPHAERLAQVPGRARARAHIHAHALTCQRTSPQEGQSGNVCKHFVTHPRVSTRATPSPKNRARKCNGAGDGWAVAGNGSARAGDGCVHFWFPIKRRLESSAQINSYSPLACACRSKLLGLRIQVLASVAICSDYKRKQGPICWKCCSHPHVCKRVCVYAHIRHICIVLVLGACVSLDDRWHVHVPVYVLA